MARRSAAGHGVQTAAPVADDGPPPGYAHDGFPPDDPWRDDPGDRRRRKRPRAGSGGRWWIWVGRAILWAFILVVIFNGIRAPFERFTSGATTTPPTQGGATDNGFPTEAASAYALQFAHVYLNYDQATPGVRATSLAQFLPEGADPQFGWNGSGRQVLQQASVASVSASDAQHGIVRLAVLINGRSMRLDVPIYADGGALGISGRPALLPPPAKAAVPSAGNGQSDEAAENELRPWLTNFFQAYAAGGQSLSQYLAEGAAVEGLSGSVRFKALREVTAQPGDTTRQVNATVEWQMPSLGSGGSSSAGGLTQTYQLTVVNDTGKWFVKEVRGSTEPYGP
ncbi:MAG: conjugal transfer protein [Streptosporangiales bacterium]|nr:conjugal transfer protein [Streptosporangiales bacterium]